MKRVAFQFACWTLGALINGGTAWAAQAPSPGVDHDNAMLVHANNTFALDLYKRLASGPGENVFFSPYSVSTALAMTGAGAWGQTEAQISKALRLDALPKTAIAPSFAVLQKSLNSVETKAEVHLTVANSLWPQQDHPLLHDYVKSVQDDFAAAIFPVDYKTQADAARLQINHWVADKTNDKIQNLLPTGSVNAATRLILVNAIYFKGNWAEQFDAPATASAPFTLAHGGTKSVALMFKKMSARYADFPDDPVPLSIAALPYKSGALEFVALLPKSSASLPDLEKNLTTDKLDAWLGKLSRPRDIEVYLPKFKLTQRYNLIPPLQALGISAAFTSAADFSGIDGARDLFISGVVHQAFVDVNEEGTEATAATGVIMTLALEASPPVFRADHPFIFLIRDTATGSILFLGRFATPPDAN